MTLARNTLLKNRYRMLEILGEGGMGAVYKARDENLGVTVAVKENLYTSEEYVRQFRVEATILASLRHPNLTRVTDHFEEGEGQYLVMDYIEGEDLRERMDRLGILDEDEVIVIGMAICEALTYLHTRIPTILHRDIKPGNVKIAPDGKVYLVDFGLAKIDQGGMLTETGARAMTPGYSPPEQYGTARTDARSDIYSLGATLYSALTGSLPEDGLARAMNQAELTPLRKLNPKISRKLASVIEKALAVQPDERYQTAEEFQKALHNCRSATRRRGNQSPLTVTPPPHAQANDSHTIQLPDQPHLTPDKAIIVAEKPEAAAKKAAPVPRPKPEKTPVQVSPPGSIARPSVPVSRPVESDTESVFETSPGTPRRRRLGCVPLILLIILLLGGGGATAYYVFPQQTSQALSFFLSPSSTTIPPPAPSPSPTPTDVNLVQPSETAEPLTAAAPPSTPTATPLPPTNTPTPLPSPTSTPSPIPSPTFTPLPPLPTPTGGSGQIAFASDRSGLPQIWVMNVDGSGLRQVTEMSKGACQPDWSPDGTKIVFISPCVGEKEEYPGASMYIINLDGTGLTALPTTPGGDYDPAWSPDGKFIAFSSLRNGRTQVFALNLDTMIVQLLAGDGFKNMQPEYYRGGEKIIFVTARRGPFQIWWMNPDGTQQELFSRSGELKDTLPASTPDGELIVFTQREFPVGIPNLVAAPVAEAGFTEYFLIDDLTPRRSPHISPDGVWVVYESWPNGVNHDIYLMTLDGEYVTQLTTDPAYEFDPVWRPVP